MPATNLPNALLKFGLALAKHYVKKVIGNEAMQEIAATAGDLSGEEVKAKVDSILGNKEGEKQLLKAAKAADKNFIKKCKDKDFRELFTMEHGDLPSVQTAIANLPKELDDEALHETLFKVFRSELPKRVSDEQVKDGVNLYEKCLQDALLPVKDFGLHVLHSELKEIGRDVKDIKADVKSLLEQAKANQQPIQEFYNPADREGYGVPRLVGYTGAISQYIQRPVLEKDICDALNKYRLVTLHGYGGIGKTRLAYACAEKVMSNYRDDCFFISLDGKGRSRQVVIDAIIDKLRLSFRDVNEKNLMIILEDKAILLWLDSYESAASKDAQDLIRDLLQETQNVRLMVTGQVPVNLMDTEKIIEVPVLGFEERKQLFTARARLRVPDWQENTDNSEYVKKILAFTEGIPLAIELAAAWVDRRSEKQIAKGLEDTPLGEISNLPPEAGFTNGLKRHDGLSRSLDWSFNLLNDSEKECLTYLGVFGGIFAAEFVAEACHIPNAQVLLDRLGDVSLIARDHKSGYYSMHGFTRQYAREKLALREDEYLIHKNYLEYYWDYEKKIIPKLDDPIFIPQRIEYLEQLNYEIDNLRKALKWSKENNEKSGLKLASKLWRFWYFTGRFDEGKKWIKDMWEKVGASAEPEIRWETLHGLGNINFSLGHYAEAIENFNDALKITDSSLNKAKSLNGLGHVFWHEGHYNEAAIKANKSLEELNISHELGAEQFKANVHMTLGIIALGSGNLDLAFSQFEDNPKHHYDGRLAAAVNHHRGMLYLIRAEYKAAWKNIEVAYKYRSESEDLAAIIQSIEGIADLTGAQGRAKLAAKLWGAADRWRQDYSAPLPAFYSEVKNTYENNCRNILGSDEFDRAFAEGRVLKIEERKKLEDEILSNV